MPWIMVVLVFLRALTWEDCKLIIQTCLLRPWVEFQIMESPPPHLQVDHHRSVLLVNLQLHHLECRRLQCLRHPLQTVTLPVPAPMCPHPHLEITRMLAQAIPPPLLELHRGIVLMAFIHPLLMLTSQKSTAMPIPAMLLQFHPLLPPETPPPRWEAPTPTQLRRHLQHPIPTPGADSPNPGTCPTTARPFRPLPHRHPSTAFIRYLQQQQEEQILPPHQLALPCSIQRAVLQWQPNPH
jgi:hypothetical protein